jgi:hypothetical protein
VESSCEFGTEPSGSMKCWKTILCKLSSAETDMKLPNFQHQACNTALHGEGQCTPEGVVTDEFGAMVE